MVAISEIVRKLQHYDQDDTLEHLLQNPEFIAWAKQAFGTLPANTQIAARGIVSNSALRSSQLGSNKSDKTLAAVRKVTSIALPVEVEERYKNCTVANFWIFRGAEHNFALDNNQPIELFLSRIYLTFTSLNSQRTWDTIVWRFLLQFFADLVALLGRSEVTAGLENTFVRMLVSSGMIKDAVDVIKGNLSSWRAKGTRYAALSDQLGDGALFLLPKSVTDTQWEELPISTSKFKSVVQHLQHLGFSDELNRIHANPPWPQYPPGSTRTLSMECISI